MTIEPTIELTVEPTIELTMELAIELAIELHSRGVMEGTEAIEGMEGKEDQTHTSNISKYPLILYSTLPYIYIPRDSPRHLVFTDILCI